MASSSNCLILTLLRHLDKSFHKCWSNIPTNIGWKFLIHNIDTSQCFYIWISHRCVMVYHCHLDLDFPNNMMINIFDVPIGYLDLDFPNTVMINIFDKTIGLSQTSSCSFSLPIIYFKIYCVDICAYLYWLDINPLSSVFKKYFLYMYYTAQSASWPLHHIKLFSCALLTIPYVDN